MLNACATRMKKINKQWRKLCMKNISNGILESTISIRFKYISFNVFFAFVFSFCSNSLFFQPLISGFVALGTFHHHSSVFKFSFFCILTANVFNVYSKIDLLARYIRITKSFIFCSAFVFLILLEQLQ